MLSCFYYSAVALEVHSHLYSIWELSDSTSSMITKLLASSAFVVSVTTKILFAVQITSKEWSCGFNREQAKDTFDLFAESCQNYAGPICFIRSVRL
ncbi:hypothetical protein RB195_017159 [Necator americanus]|uniref:Uncharacterized protein n=1 Tax=Necator americanus TaxID=51031 RepID=A0ABR1C3W9_NECAM